MAYKVLIFALILPRTNQQILVKAPLRVLYDKIQHKGGVEWQIQHEAKARVYGAFTDLLVLCGRIDYS